MKFSEASLAYKGLLAELEIPCVESFRRAEGRFKRLRKLGRHIRKTPLQIDMDINNAQTVCLSRLLHSFMKSFIIT